MKLVCMIRLALVSMLMTLSAAVVSAQSFDDYMSQALMGDAEAQFYLGECYYYGNGVEQNIDEAYVWLRKAMEQEYTPALDYFG